MRFWNIEFFFPKLNYDFLKYFQKKWKMDIAYEKRDKKEGCAEKENQGKEKDNDQKESCEEKSH